MTCSIDELRKAGVILEADEAVAITQQVIAALCEPRETDEVQPPCGPPSTDNVFVNEDGTVFCRGCKATAEVSDIGNFLESLLPEGSPRVPGVLRYIIARALLKVDVPPFGSLDQLSRDLARHEFGDRAAAVRRVLARYGAVSSAAAVTRVERRRQHALVTDLRRALREADARLFEREQLQRDLVIDVPPQTEPGSGDRTRLVAASCLAAGLVLVSMGELMHIGHAPSAATETAPIVATQSAPIMVSTAAPEEVRIEPAPVAASAVNGIIAVHATPASRVTASRPEPRRLSQRASRSQAGTGRRAVSRPVDPDQRKRGVLDRLRLGWLRSVL